MASNPQDRIIRAGNEAWRPSIHWREDAYLAAAREALIIAKARIGTDYDPEFELDRLLKELTPKETPDGEETRVIHGREDEGLVALRVCAAEPQGRDDGDQAPPTNGQEVPRVQSESLTPDAALLEVWSPADARVRCVNCRFLATDNLNQYTFCGNDDGPIGHVNFGCGDKVENEIQNVWCSAFEPQDWLSKQGTLFGYHGNQPGHPWKGIVDEEDV